MTVSPMMDSATVNLAMSQINFIEFVVAPLYAVFGRLFPETSTTLARLVNNRMHYQALLERELDEVPVCTKNRAEDASSRVDGSGFVDGATPPPGAHAGEGKTPEERSKERATTRARPSTTWRALPTRSTTPTPAPWACSCTTTCCAAGSAGSRPTSSDS